MDFERLGKTLLDHLGEAVYVSGVDREILYVNPACVRLLGEGAAGAVGRRCFEVFGDPERPCSDPCAAEVAAKAGWTPGEHRARFRVSSGELQDFRAACIPVTGDAGEILQLIHILTPQEQSQRAWARLADSEARYRTLFNHVTDAVFIASTTGGILEANEEACRRLGYSRTEFLQLSPSDFDSERFKPEVAGRMRQIMEQGYAVFESAHVTREGREIPVEVNACRCEIQGVDAVLAICRDIRQRKEDDMARRRARADLERVNRELRRLNERLAEVDRLKTDLLTNVSHELRTPLVTVRGYLELMRGGRLGPTTERQDNALAVMQSSQQRLLTLIERLLDFTRLEGDEPRLSLEPIVLQELCEHVVNGFRPRAEEAQVSLEVRVVEGPVELAGDRPLLETLLVNLLDNAIKFNQPGGRVEVACTTADDPDRIRFTVRDTGVGISPDQHLRVFERFHQVDASSTREHGGTGIGLSLARSIAQQHGGDIHLESTPGQGSCFTVELPRTPPREADGV